MKNVMGLVFANIYDSSLGQLTNKRTQASLPYGGRYRQIDFTLSNMANAGIRHICIVTQYNFQSLMNHIGSGEEWDLELAENGLEFITPYSMGESHTFRGKLDAIYTASASHLERSKEEYIILADAAVICSINLEEVVHAHIASGKDVTVVVKAGIANGEKQLDLGVKLDADGEIADMAVDFAASKDYLASMGMFIMRKDLLLSSARACVSHNRFRFEREFILQDWLDNKISVGAFECRHVALFNESPVEYFRNNLAIIRRVVRHDLYREGLPIYTKVRDQVPTYYGENSEVDDCIVADGCKLLGAASNSVLFRGVKLSTGASVKNCVVMSNCEIGIGAELEYCILDKDVKISAGKKLIGTMEHPVILNRGDVV
ncbi:MAG: glucose-1-phosphate adenylyltransferase subunit GlgD [Oscillospiraceae bacterium]|nr:glucose-1-phosphate adenylyltransferase subunit GlgD [Oscillospiraceae bacterium]